MLQKGMIFFIPPLCDPTTPLLGPYQLSGYACKIGCPFHVYDRNISFLEHIVDYARNAVLGGPLIPNDTLDAIEYAACVKFIASFDAITSYQDALNALRKCESIGEYWRLMDYIRACYDVYSLQFEGLRFRIDGLDCIYRWNIWEDIEGFARTYSNSSLMKLIRSWIKTADFSQANTVGINITFESQLFFAILFCIAIREIRPDVYIIAGGGFINSFIDSAGSIGPLAKYCDTVYSGEGEALLWYIQRLGKDNLAELRTLGERDNEKHANFVVPENLCPIKLTVYPPHITQKQLSLYFSPARVLPLRFSYKCYWGKCKFCADKEWHDCLEPEYDYKNMIEYCIEKNREGLFDGIYFLDSAISAEILKTFCESILKNGAHFSWGTNTRFDKDFAEGSFIRLLSAAGCVFIKSGLESGAQRVLNLMNKGINLNNAANIIHLCRQNNILVHTYVLFAYPGETGQDRKATKQFLLDEYTHPDNYNSSEFILYGSAPIAKELPYSFEERKGKEIGWHSSSFGFSNEIIRSFISNMRKEFDNKYNPARVLLSTGHTISMCSKFKNSKLLAVPITKKPLCKDTIVSIGERVVQTRYEHTFIIGIWRRRDGFIYFKDAYAEIFSKLEHEFPINDMVSKGFTVQCITDLLEERFLKIAREGNGEAVPYQQEDAHFEFIYGNKFNALKWYGYYDVN